MLQILLVTFPFFALVLAGFIAARRRLLPLEAIPGLNTFVLYFALPALLFRALSQRDLGEVLNGSFLVAYAAGSLALLCGGHLLSRHVFHKPASLAALKGLGMSASNSGGPSGRCPSTSLNSWSIPSPSRAETGTISRKGNSLRYSSITCCGSS